MRDRACLDWLVGRPVMRGCEEGGEKGEGEGEGERSIGVLASCGSGENR